VDPVFTYSAGAGDDDRWLVVRTCAADTTGTIMCDCPTEQCAIKEARRLNREEAARTAHLAADRAELAKPREERKLAPGFYTDEDAQ
jgi:hypothetical protein